MSPTLTCLALAFVGVDFGYRPMSNGGLEFIVQIAPSTFQTLRRGDPITVAVTPEARQFRPSQVTVELGDGPPSRIPPPLSASSPVAAAAPAPAPNVPASRLPPSMVRPAVGEEPASTPGPALTAPEASGPLTVKPPSGPPAQPTTSDEQAKAADPRGTSSLPGSGRPVIPDLAQVDAGKEAGGRFPSTQLGLLLVIIALAASNGYVGWLFWDARQRYLALLARTFAAST